jgi:hypothetical protein
MLSIPQGSSNPSCLLWLAKRHIWTKNNNKVMFYVLAHLNWLRRVLDLWWYEVSLKTGASVSACQAALESMLSRPPVLSGAGGSDQAT